MDRRAAWVLGIIFGGLYLCLFAFMLLLFVALRGEGGKGGALTGGGGDRVGVVEVLGPIADSKKTVKQLEAFREDARIKAVVLRVDSPGGAVGPAQEIFDEVRKVKGKKKVVASMGSMAASGGLYIAAGADRIYANPGTLTGSIGVIMQLPNVEGLMKWAGVEMNTLTAGKMKDVGNPFRAMSDDERAYFTALLEDVHEQFVAAVAEGRGLPPEEVRAFADGRIFTGRKAKELKLIDELGGLEDAVAAAGKLGGIHGEPKTEYPKQDKRLLRELLGDDPESLFQGAAEKVLNAVGGAGLQYRLPTVEAH